MDRQDVKVAYLTSYYPAPTHTFIRDEIHSLEKLGCSVNRFTHHRAPVLVDFLDLQELSITHHLSGRFFGRALSSVIRTFLIRPLATIKTLSCALRLGIVGDRRIASHIGHFILACALSEEIAKIGDPHIHAHFSISPTDVAYLCNKLRGLSYSFTLHATYEYEHPKSLNLLEKIAGAEFVVTISEHGRNSLIDRFPEFKHKVQVIPCGLSDEWHQLSDQPVAANRRLVTIARLETQKNLENLLSALEIVNSQAIPFELVIAGDGSKKAQLQQTISTLGLDNKVSIVGWCTRDQIKKHLLSADALVLSSDDEGIPMAILEAAALARPTIATNVGGVAEVVETAKTGWLVPPQDSSALADAIVQCLQTTQGELQRLGEAARARVLMRSSLHSAARLKRLFKPSAVTEE